MSRNPCCPHCGAKQNSSSRTCLSCGMDRTKASGGKDASFLMKNIGRIRTATFLLILLIGICTYIIERYYQTLGRWGDILTAVGYVLLVLFLVFLIILMKLGNRNYEDSSEELSEYKKKHIGTFIRK